MATSLSSQRMIGLFEQLIELHERPASLRLDDRMELTSHVVVEWAAERGIGLRFIEPEKPNRKACIELFNRAYHTEVLNA